MTAPADTATTAITRPAAKGWCPGALRPMMSGDGLLVRIRPRLGRLCADQATALCTAATTHGSGVIDLTSRANLQVRGVQPARYDALLADLDVVGLVDQNEATEARRNILTSPFWVQGDDTWQLATELDARLSELPELPAKFGFAVDTGAARLVASSPADIRIERSASGGLIVRADGVERGVTVSVADAVDHVIDMARWFAETGGISSKRMAQHVARVPLPMFAAFEAPVAAGAALAPGWSPIGPVCGAAFGQIFAPEFARLINESGARAVRVTPTRMFVLEGGRPVANTPFLSDGDDPIFNVDACPGAPFCASASVETRALAVALRGAVAGSLHVSGCAKGCARSSVAQITLVGRDGMFDLVRDGCASDQPEIRGLSAADAMALVGGDHAL